jgi:uncharacterized protein YciI
MTIFAVTYHYVADSAEKRQEALEVHRQFLAEQASSGALLAAGPYGPEEEEAGALLIWKADSKLDVLEVVQRDPFALEGLIGECTVRAWTLTRGGFAQ